ncbi:MAG: sensor histidine kinase [Vallitaleaceae bacterium]|nr:sensor histidine kinase [Vallitaleaceae bacterium]
MNYDKKMLLLISIAIISTAMIIMISSAVSANTSLMKKSRNLVQIQINTISNNLQFNLENYYNTSITLVMDGRVQDFLKIPSEELKEQPDVVNNLRNNLASMLNMQSHINFIAIVKEMDQDYFYKGDSSITYSKFIEKFDEDYNNSDLAGYSTMRVSVNNVYFDQERFSTTIYQPIYDKYRIGKVIGLLCINIDEEGLLMPVKDKQKGTTEMEFCLVGLDGTIIFNSKNDQIGNQVSYFEQLDNDSGSFQLGKNLYVYEKLGSWNYYLISSIPMKVITKDGINAMIFMLLIIIAAVLISLFIGSQIIKKSYQPLHEIVGKMSTVSKGCLNVRMKEDELGNDFSIMANSFNIMMDQLNALVEQVKEDQHQVDQIRFNALQSQIKPHFLYNTLECIHWQALTDGNKVVSTLVKALATYYRISLSKGQDIITLSQELVLIESYITIQNMRYDDIVACEITIEEVYQDIKIPKMTLQPLMENAIYHGIKIKEGKKGLIKINAFERDSAFIIQVEDSGTGMTQQAIDEMNQSISVHNEVVGYGVRNVNRRIEMLFGEQYGLFYQKNDAGGITVQISLPNTH